MLPRSRILPSPLFQKRPLHTLPTLRPASTSPSPSATMPPKHEFIVILPDHDGALEKRMRVRQSHLSALTPGVESGFWRFGGAMLSTPLLPGQAPQMRGSVMLALAESEEEVMQRVREDVYAKEEVWDMGKVQIWPFKTAVKDL